MSNQTKFTQIAIYAAIQHMMTATGFREDIPAIGQNWDLEDQRRWEAFAQLRLNVPVSLAYDVPTSPEIFEQYVVHGIDNWSEVKDASFTHASTIDGGTYVASAAPVEGANEEQVEEVSEPVVEASVEPSPETVEIPDAADVPVVEGLPPDEETTPVAEETVAETVAEEAPVVASEPVVADVQPEEDPV